MQNEYLHLLLILNDTWDETMKNKTQQTDVEKALRFAEYVETGEFKKAFLTAFIRTIHEKGLKQNVKH